MLPEPRESPLSRQERHELSSDYLQRYHRVLLDDEEAEGFKMHGTAISVCGLLSAIAIPWQLINMLTVRDNPELLRPQLAKSSVMAAALATALMIAGSQQRAYHHKLTQKYFAHLDDYQIKNSPSLFMGEQQLDLIAAQRNMPVEQIQPSDEQNRFNPPKKL